jgi:hypothetical protein
MATSSDISLFSPDRRVEVRCTWAGTPATQTFTWQVWFAGHLMVAPSSLGLFPGWGVASVVRSRRGHFALLSDVDNAVWLDHRNEMVVRLREQAAPQRRLDLIFWCCDHGAAVRMRVPRQRGVFALPAAGAGVNYRFPVGTAGWLPVAGGGFRPVPLALAPMCETPLTLQYPHGKLACLLTAGGAPLTLRAAGDGWAVDTALLTPKRPYLSPWQVVLLADAPRDLLAQSSWLPTLAPCPRADVPVCEAVANCTLPFVRYALWPANRPGAPTAAPDVTPAHRLAVALLAGGGESGWDETRVLRGAIGAFLVLARRSGQVWQVGGITGAEGRVLTVRLEEILNGVPWEDAPPYGTYTLEIVRDPLPGEAAADGVVRETFHGVDLWDKPRLELLPKGGFLLRLEPEAAAGRSDAARGLVESGLCS